ncbi:MAG: carboxypeptidase regulatory-like domain-containing protein [Acidobacteriaceae bacterium]|nr:carboxypeptidase regulatory-like domain-containing protein [Acidobacteriaceae bacterium]
MGLFFCSPVFSQVNTSTIAGVVTDPSGAGVSGAKVSALLAATRQERETVTNSLGEYVLPQLAPGEYRISISSPGFQTVVETITLNIAERVTANVTLKLGQVSDEVNVTATAPLLEQETASLGQVISRKAINDLPLNGRNYITLGSLSPGVIPQLPTGTGSASFIASTTQRSDRSLLVGGQRESSTSYLYDGVEMRNPRIGDSSITPSLDAVQEFKIQRNFFQAEFGNSPAIINVASRSGTNEFHGAVFEFLRNDAMDARNFFSSAPEPFKRNQYGGVGGGWVKKDKVFFFGNFEGFRQRLGVIQRGTFPTQSMLSGNFSGLATIYDPLTYNSTGNGTRQPFPNNIIPPDRINSVSKNFFPYIPVTNLPGANNVSGTPVQSLNDDQLNVRGDWLISTKHSLFGRYSWQNAPLSPASLTPLGGSLVASKGVSGVAQLTSSLTTSVVNVARVSYAYMKLFGQQVPVDKNIAQQIGITGVSTSPVNWGVPGVGWQGFSSIGSNGLTQGNIMNNYQITDDVTWIRGGHTIKAGYDIRQSRLLLDSDNGPRGSFTFNASYTAALDPVTGNPVAGTGNGVADFLLGYPTNMSGAVGTSATHFTFWTHNLFVQDDWKVTRELTLNYGLRWEYMGPPRPIDQELNHVYGFDFNTGKQLFPVLGQIRPSVVNPDYKDFAPRLGFAYNPAWASSWVMRGGIGIYYDQTQLNETQFITNGPPIFTQQNINLTGRGLPTYQFGVNTLPVVTIPPVNSNYVTPAGTNLFVEEIDGRKPRVYMLTLSVQKSLFNNWVVEAAYAGSHGRRLSKRYNAYSNVTPGVLYDVTPGVATRYPQLNQMLYSSLGGWSDFNALNLRLEKRFSTGWQLLVAHTWAHSIDTDSAGSYGSPNLNPANFQLDKGSSDFDIRHRFVASVVYELPFGRGKHYMSSANRGVDLLVGGWQLNTITSWQTGVQRSVSSTNLTGISYVTQRADATGINPYSSFNGIDPGSDFGGANSARYWFNPAAFAATAPLKFGTSGRDIIQAPSWWDTDISAFKNFPIRESMYLQFRAEAFNALNNVKFFPPDMSVVSPTFALLESADRPRVLQMALRFNF